MLIYLSMLGSTNIHYSQDFLNEHMRGFEIQCARTGGASRGFLYSIPFGALISTAGVSSVAGRQLIPHGVCDFSGIINHGGFSCTSRL